MARYNEIVDLQWTHGGDFVLGTDGDLKDTKNEAYRGFIQMVLTRMMSSRGDWSTQPGVGASLSKFLGKRNTREIGDAIRQRVYSELVQEGLMSGGELQVDVVPISKTGIAIFLVINPPRSSGQVVLTFTYDMRDNKVIPRNT